MKLRSIPLGLVHVPEIRVTAVYSEELQQLLKSTVAAMGIVQPIVVVANGEAYELVDGLHRLQVAQERGDERIQAVVYEGGPADALVMNLVLNRSRGKTKASEMVKAIKALYELYGMDLEAVVKKSGLGEDYINKLLKISTASTSVLEALDEELIGVGHAYEIARLPSHAAQDEVMSTQRVWRWKIPDLRAQVDQVLKLVAEQEGAPAAAPRREPQRHYCEGCHQEAELGQLRPALLCPTCYGVVYRHAKESSPPSSSPPGP